MKNTEKSSSQTLNPMNSLEVGEVFLNYDGPKIFTAVLPTGEMYLVNTVAEDEDGRLTYLYLPISQQRLHEVRTTMPLYDATVNAEGGVVYVAMPDSGLFPVDDINLGRQEMLIPMKATDIPFDYLPEEGLILR